VAPAKKSIQRLNYQPSTKFSRLKTHSNKMYGKEYHMTTDYDIIIIGSGPGGYVAAIRASQLGMRTAVVERAELGGVCLNWGCIPTKSLLKSAQVCEYIKHAEDYGIEIKEAVPNFQKIIERSRGVSLQMNKGVEYLFKKNNVTHIQGNGKLKDHKTVEVNHHPGHRIQIKRYARLQTGRKKDHRLS
jgi:pyruvate/2-oxoglutarate dehydrogenase complex dihydrolipoamide dehydrogenase (E3) component